jgi:hypothetical protein
MYVPINFHKNGLGYILGDFLINSSGHPDSQLAKVVSNILCTVRCRKWPEESKIGKPEIDWQNKKARFPKNGNRSRIEMVPGSWNCDAIIKKTLEWTIP